MNSKRPIPSCSLCWGFDHRAKGTIFPLTGKQKAQLITWNDIAEMMSNLGNQDYFLVSHPDMDTTKQINQWFFGDGSCGIVSNEIPAGACHLVLLDTYYCPTPNQHICHNLIAVTVLEEGGRTKSGWVNAFFANHQIADWLEKHRVLRQRRRHSLSALRRKTGTQHVSQSNMYIYNSAKIQQNCLM
jgi:hypothetical protein